MSKFNKGKFKKKGYVDKRTSNSRPLGVNKNNPMWYMLTQLLGKLATAINMFVPNGTDIRFADGSNLNNSSIALTREPGIARNEIMLVPAGVSNAPTDALNEACRSMFTYIRQKLMKNITRYEKSDLFIMVYAVANIIAWKEYLKLILRVLKKYNPMNKYTPIALLTAMNIDTNDVNNLGVQLQFYIEKLAHRLGNLIVPKLPIYEEVAYAFSHIYVDEDIAKAQYIINVPVYIWKFVIDPTTSKGKLVPKAFSNQSPFTYNDIVNFTEDLLSNLINDEDYAFMSGDIKATYEGNLLSIETDVDVTPIEFEYSKEYLERWHNSAQFGHSPFDGVWSGWELTQDTSASLDDYLKFDPEWTASSEVMFNTYKRSCGNRILDFYDREVTPEQIMESTRWLFSNKIVDETNRKMKIMTCGTQLIYRVQLYYFDKNNTLQTCTYYGYHAFSKTSASGRYGLTQNDINAMLNLRKFNYAPLSIMMLETSVSGETSGYVGLLGDLGNYTPIEPRILENMNSLANYTILGVSPLLEGK